MLALSFCKHHEIKFFASKVHHKCSQFRSEHQCFLLVSTPSKVRVVRTRHLDQMGESLVLKFQGLILLIFFSQLSLLFFNSSLPSGFTFFCFISSFISFFLDSNNAFSLSFFFYYWFNYISIYFACGGIYCNTSGFINSQQFICYNKCFNIAIFVFFCSQTFIRFFRGK